MARPPRQSVAGGVYHVVARGNRGSAIFCDEADYAEYLKLLGKGVTRYRWHLLAYCLMGNHVHLVVETPEPTLPAGMQWLHGKYGRYFNDRHELFGHLFQGRYKSIRQETDEQLWHVLRYVALNPVEAGLCPRPRDYRWSSYGAALGSGPWLIAVNRLSWFTGARGEEEARGDEGARGDDGMRGDDVARGDGGARGDDGVRGHDRARGDDDRLAGYRGLVEEEPSDDAPRQAANPRPSAP